MSSLWKGRQKMLEALGRADATHSDSIQSLDRMRKLIKEGARNVHHRIDSEVKATEAAVVHGKAVGEAFHAFSGSTNQFGELSVLGRVLQQLGEFVAQAEEVQQTLDTDIVRQVQVPLDAQIKELQKAKIARKNFEKARLDYDTAGTKLASLKKSKNVNQAKIQQGEQEVQQTKQAMEAAGQQAAQNLVETNSQAETELIAKCSAFVELHRAFYERGLRLCASYNAALTEFRTHVERRQQEVNTDKSRAKNTMIKELHNATTGSRDAYFGLPLSVLQEKDGVTVPRLLTSSFIYLREACLDDEGLFRISSAKNQLMEVIHQIDNGQFPSWAMLNSDSALVADVVKHFFRELPEPLLTHKLYSEFLQANNIGDEKEKLTEFSRLIAALPAENRAVAAELCHFLSDVASHSAKNKMGAANLATIFGPSLLAAPNYAPTNMGEEMALANLALVTVRNLIYLSLELITKHETLFGVREASPIRTRAGAFPALPRPPSPRPDGLSSRQTVAPPSPLPSGAKPIPRPTSPRPEGFRAAPTASPSTTVSTLPPPTTSPTGQGLSPRGAWRTAAPPET